MCRRPRRHLVEQNTEWLINPFLKGESDFKPTDLNTINENLETSKLENLKFRIRASSAQVDRPADAGSPVPERSHGCVFKVEDICEPSGLKLGMSNRNSKA